MIPALLGLLPLVRYIPDLVKSVGRLVGGKTKDAIDKGEGFVSSVTSALENGEVTQETELAIFRLIESYRQDLYKVNKDLTKALLDAGAKEAEVSIRKIEMTAEDPWTRRWRPFWGYTSAVTFFVEIVLSFIVLLLEKASISELTNFVFATSAIWAVPASILTVTAYHRGRMQRINAGEVTTKKSPGLVKRVVTAITGDHNSSHEEDPGDIGNYGGH